MLSTRRGFRGQAVALGANCIYTKQMYNSQNNRVGAECVADVAMVTMTGCSAWR